MGDQPVLSMQTKHSEVNVSNKDAFQIKQNKICQKYGADLKISAAFHVEIEKKKGSTVFTPDGVITIYDASGKQLQQIIIGGKYGKIKSDEETVNSDMSPDTIISSMPAIITHFAKKCVDEMTAQTK